MQVLKSTLYRGEMESLVRSREEDEELQSMKKVKECHCDKPAQGFHVNGAGAGGLSYKDSLMGEILGAFDDLPPGEVAVKLSGDRKSKIKASWSSALIMKVFGRTVGYHFL